MLNYCHQNRFCYSQQNDDNIGYLKIGLSNQTLKLIRTTEVENKAFRPSTIVELVSSTKWLPSSQFGKVGGLIFVGTMMVAV